jgi:hypothetical protein
MKDEKAPEASSFYVHRSAFRSGVAGLRRASPSAPHDEYAIHFDVRL